MKTSKFSENESNSFSNANNINETYQEQNCVDGLFYLKNDHMYYYQVQQQLSQLNLITVTLLFMPLMKRIN